MIVIEELFAATLHSSVVNGEVLACDRDLVSRKATLRLDRRLGMIPRSGAGSEARLVSCALLDTTEFAAEARHTTPAIVRICCYYLCGRMCTYIALG